MMIFKNEGGEEVFRTSFIIVEKKKKKSDGSETISYLHCTLMSFIYDLDFMLIENGKLNLGQVAIKPPYYYFIVESMQRKCICYCN